MNPITHHEQDVQPCVVIGSGVAGHAAMVWLGSYGVPALWLSDSMHVGGMLHRVHNPLVNVPGKNYPHGKALTEAIDAQLEGSSITPPTLAHLRRISDEGEHFVLHLEAAPAIKARCVLLATGTRYGSLTFDGQDTPSAHVTTTDSAYFSESAAHDGARFAGKTVAVVGGGDAAFENALTLANEHGCTVNLMMRSRPKARRKFVDRVIKAHRSIKVWPIPTTIARVKEHDTHITLELDSKGATLHIDVACVFVRIGVRPTLPDFHGFTLDANDSGYVKVDDAQRTSHSRIFAAGDITHTAMQSIVTSASEAAKAALSIAEELGAYDFSEQELSRLVNVDHT